ncbi:MAG: hypothetical protein LH617_08160 [Ramlibacter sp.]|nr:hypothetical protein [Ramlibacter sp.]
MTSPTVDRIVALLRDEESRDNVVRAVAEQQSVVTQFVSLLLQEEKRQSEDGKKDSAITFTDTQCKP